MSARKVITAWLVHKECPPKDCTLADIRQASACYADARTELPGGTREEVYQRALELAEERAARDAAKPNTPSRPLA